MNTWLLISKQISRICFWISAGAIIAIMAITLTDISARFLFRLTGGGVGIVVKGSVELVKYLLFISMLAAMAASVERSQVVVEVFTHKLRATLKQRVASSYLLVFMGVGIVLSAGLWDAAGLAFIQGHTTQDLKVSMGYIYAAGSLLSALLAFRCLLHGVIETVRPGVGEHNHEQ